MTARRWHRQQQRTLMHRRGVESVHGDTQIATEVQPSEPSRRALIKAQQRAELEAAVAAYNVPTKKIPAGKRRWGR
jgi:hypothetical protein